MKAEIINKGVFYIVSIVYGEETVLTFGKHFMTEVAAEKFIAGKLFKSILTATSKNF